jgi:WD40 repeat protein
VQELLSGDPVRVGPYRMLGRLGVGGMGRVFLGRSAGGRLVAVKVIKDELVADPEFRARFRQEVAGARLVSGLFTAPVVDADLDGPTPWLATAYVAGPSLADAVSSHGPLPAGSVLALAAALAEGLAAIHAANVVHRDLKPSNVLLAADGPRIIDFGIARAAEAMVHTLPGLVLGSPGFMSPEQAEGRETGPPSDVFSLGAVLAFAATGSGPFGSGYVTALMYRVVHGTPDLDKVPDRVRGVVERCLAKEPARRPTPASLLAELGGADLSPDWLPGTFTGEYPAVAAPPATRSASAVPLTAGSPAGGSPAGGSPAGGSPAGGRTAGLPVAAGPTLAPGSLAPPAGPVRAALVRSETAGALLARLDHESAVRSVRFIARGERVVTVSGTLVRQWDAAMTEAAQLRHQLDVRDTAVSPDGTTIATSTASATFSRRHHVLLWDAAKGTPAGQLAHRRGVTGIKFSPDGARIATVSDDTSVRLWDRRTGLELGPQRSGSAIGQVLFSPDGSRFIALGYAGRETALLDTATGQEVTVFRTPVVSAAFSPGGGLLLTFGADQTARLWNAVTGRGLLWNERMTQWTAAFSPAGDRLATASVDHTVRLWDPRSGQELARRPHGSPVTAVAFSPDGSRLATVSDGTTVHLLDPASGVELTRLTHDSAVTMITFSPDSARLITGSTDRTILLWDVASGDEISRVRHDTVRVFSPDRTQLATGQDCLVRLLDLATGTELAQLWQNNPTPNMLFSPDGAQLATRDGKTVSLWAT